MKLFHELPVESVNNHKHLGLILDEKLNFNIHLNMITEKVTKTICVLIFAIYKSFIRSHLEYSDIIYDQPNNTLFSNKLG